MKSTRVLFEPVVRGAEGQERGARTSSIQSIENSPLEFRFSLEGRYAKARGHTRWVGGMANVRNDDGDREER